MIKDLPTLVKEAHTRSYPAGSIVLYQGEIPRHAFIITKGVVKACTISASGDEQIISFHQKGEMFPASWIFSKTTSTLYFYETSTDCEIALMPRSDLLRFVQHPSRIDSLVDSLVTDQAASSIRISALEQPKARDKLAYTLFYLCKRYGKVIGPRTRISLSLTHQNLGALVGLTRETTATEMSKLKKEGILSYKSQTYNVDTEKLLDIIGEESFRGIKISE